MKGVDWLTVGEAAGERAVKLALGAVKLEASVLDLAAWLKQESRCGAAWEEAGDAELQPLLSYCEERATGGKIVSLAGAKLTIAESRRGVEGVVASHCQRHRGFIGASWVGAGEWRELTLRSSRGIDLSGLCNAFGGYGADGFGRISLGASALEELLQKGYLGPLQAKTLAPAAKAKEERRLTCVMRDDLCLSGGTLVTA